MVQIVGELEQRVIVVSKLNLGIGKYVGHMWPKIEKIWISGERCFKKKGKYNLCVKCEPRESRGEYVKVMSEPLKYMVGQGVAP